MNVDLEGLTGGEAHAADQPESTGPGIVERDQADLAGRQSGLALGANGVELGRLGNLTLAFQGVRNPIGIQGHQEKGAGGPGGPERGRQSPESHPSRADGGQLLVAVQGAQGEDDGNQQGNRQEHRDATDHQQGQVLDAGTKGQPPTLQVGDAVIAVRNQDEAAKTQQAKAEDLGPFAEKIAVEDTHLPG